MEGYKRNQQYDPMIAQILYLDPIGLRGGLNLYAYAPNPLSWIDPLGLCKSESKIEDLELLHPPETIGSRPDLAKLTDSELLESVINPKFGDRVTVNTKTNKVMDGNSRVYELKKKADDPNSSITGETTIPIEAYTPDDSFFWDM